MYQLRQLPQLPPPLALLLRSGRQARRQYDRIDLLPEQTSDVQTVVSLLQMIQPPCIVILNQAFLGWAQPLCNTVYSVFRMYPRQESQLNPLSSVNPAAPLLLHEFRTVPTAKSIQVHLDCIRCLRLTSMSSLSGIVNSPIGCSCMFVSAAQ